MLTFKTQSMKKILLSVFAIAVIGFTASAQCDPNVPVLKYITGSGDAPITIDGDAADWHTAIN